MPLIKSGSKEAISSNIREMMKSGHPQKQAIAAALSTARRYGKGKAMGGPNISMEGLLLHGASRNLHSEGFIHSSIPGRTDKIPMSVPAKSYIVPADIVSGRGQGNSLAGKAVLDKMFSAGPYGMPAMRSAGRSGMSLAPRMSMRSPKRVFQEGGEAEGDDHVPIIAAGGEYSIHPAAVKVVGHGDYEAGWKVLDKLMLLWRKKNIKDQQNLKPPKK